MTPSLKPGQLVLISGLIKPKQGSVVVIRHQGLEKIKRISKINDQKVYLLGDNPDDSTDSRQFGWLEVIHIVGTVIWPRSS